MATLVLTRGGFNDLVKTLGRVPPQLWVNSDVLSETELRELRASGHDVTNFTRRIVPTDRAALETAIDTIREHHPLQRLWVVGRLSCTFRHSQCRLLGAMSVSSAVRSRAREVTDLA